MIFSGVQVIFFYEICVFIYIVDVGLLSPWLTHNAIQLTSERGANGNSSLHTETDAALL